MYSANTRGRPSAARPRRRQRAAAPLLALLALIAAAFAAPAAEAVPSAAPRITATTNGQVYTTARHGDTLYIGGSFTEIAPRTGPAVAVDASTGEVVSTPQLSGGAAEVEVVEPDGEGGYYVGGRFNFAHGEAHQGIVHVNPDGTLDRDFDPAIRETVFAIEVVGPTVYIGGRIFEVDGEERRGLAALDAETGELTSFAPEIDPGPFGNPRVYALAVDGDRVYFGGNFSDVDGEGRNRLAAVDTEGNVTSWEPQPNSEVFDLEIHGSTLYAAGKFSSVAGEARKYAAAFDLPGAGADPVLDPEWSPEANNQVNAIVVSDDGETVYLGGKFSQVDGESREEIAAVEGPEATLTGFSAELGEVTGLALGGSTLYAAGSFNTVNGQPQKGVAAFDMADEGSLVAWNPRLLTSAADVAVSGDSVVIGGLFAGAGAETRNYVAAIDVTTGEPTEWAPESSTGDYIYNLLATEDVVYLTGNFDEIGGQPRRRLAAVDTETGAATDWNPETLSTVDSMALDGDTLYVGGSFGTIGGKSRSRLAALDTETAEATDWAPTANNSSKTLVVSGDYVYAGGQFTEVNGEAQNKIAKLDKETGELVAWNPELDDTVEDIEVVGSSVYAVGRFDEAKGETRDHVVELDAGTGEPTAWAPEADSETHAIAVDGDTVYLGGNFHNVGGASRDFLAAVDATSGEALDWNPDPSGRVQALTSDGGGLYVGGLFRTLELGYQNAIAVFVEPTLTVEVGGEGNGSIASEPAGVDCDASCTMGFTTGEEVTLVAVPDPGYEFVGWSGGACSGTGPCVVVLDADTKVTALFAPAAGGEGGAGGGGGNGGGANGASAGGSAAASAAGATATGVVAAKPWINTKIKKAMIREPGRRVAGFWFATKGTEGAKRFQCALVKWPTGKDVKKRLKRKKIRFKPCGPRKRIYRHLKPGRYTFRVRAVGTHSWDRKAAKRQFRIR